MPMDFPKAETLLEKKVEKIAKRHFAKFLENAGKEILEALEADPSFDKMRSPRTGRELKLGDAAAIAALCIVEDARDEDPSGDYDGYNRYFPLVPENEEA